jgi:DNA processing protein
MVNDLDLKMSRSEIQGLCAKVNLHESDEDPIEYFGALTWSVICEPGDAFAGQLISTFGAARALELEIVRTSAKDYVSRFAETGSDWLEMQKFGRFEKTLSDARERWLPRLSTGKLKSSVETMSRLKGWFMTEASANWPEALNDLGHHAPRGLWGLGKPPSANSRSISVVGSRVASTYGEFATGELLAPLVARGFKVVSGGAYGIDAQAHRSTVALDGQTTAVMAGGLDRLYPSGNLELFKAIEGRGSLLSEMPPGAEPTKWRFLQRNRLIAALGQATIVVEANARSGAVSTANRAVDLGRPLGAVPGPINSPGSDGCHQLIRDLKAQLITCSDDILELVGENVSTVSSQSLGLGALETRVLDVIGMTTAKMEKVCAEGGLTRSEAEVGLAGLSLLGLIEQDSLGWRRRL